MNIYPKTLMLLGSGELGKEVAISAKRLGCKVIACDRYADAPAMQVADIAEILDMTNSGELKDVINSYKPDVIIPEIEALAVDALDEIERDGITVIPTARATQITMNRDKIRDLASNKLHLKTAKYVYASNSDEVKKAAKELGLPVIVKPIMSSSGKGQSFIRKEEDIELAWELALKKARGVSSRVIVEEFLEFDFEITLLTIRQKDGSTLFCPPIGHEQKNGDYQSSWQPVVITESQLQEAQVMAKAVTQELGGVGIFGVEFFITKESVIFSELSPRPHDTGLVTLISQDLSEFDLHVRAILGLPIPSITVNHPSASRVILSEKNCTKVAYRGIEKALEEEGTKILIFGKPSATKGRRMGVALAKSSTLDKALIKANNSAINVEVIQDDYSN
ncbi:formate-dependent phosphoribosylglycinamide formyltransferase [Prochlorococcus marinus]|uniref:Formate-dependent phosphoribosylglycinamide formyltransferase n=1 Tax=Prochlorococcus marinus (strain MIT 9211) TaxID=93059 RepID=A9BBA3_PROM4|nr:formate-dependent phosphoribosylglycinamide formyltransferase [Prochlorococcus marinus]ABX09115.1 Formate-dependent phosphoribosylglycinamide formyltransferase (GAR transformylase) [Prochlorococcus marinus str. MIT 9211]